MGQKPKRSRRESSFRWAHQFVLNHKKHTDALTEKFEISYPFLAMADADETPVNIICFDGGGMKGTPQHGVINFCFMVHCACMIDFVVICKRLY